jgi:S-disulfanyl-L-cysteine oxidoreductase SoxD
MSKLLNPAAILFAGGAAVGSTLTAAFMVAPSFVSMIEPGNYVLFTPAQAQTPAASAQASVLSLGRVALPEEIEAWDVAVLPDGQGLRPGSGSVEDGEELFVNACGACHGDFAEGIDSWPPLAGGLGSLTDARPLKTVGSYWPYLSTVYDYIHRSMPFGGAQTLSVDEVYAITAYILYSNSLVDSDFVLTHENFTQIVLPNAEGFYIDDRDTVEVPLFSTEPCMTDCVASVSVTRRAVEIGVTPMDAPGVPAGTLPDTRADVHETAVAVVQEAAAEAVAEPAVAEAPVVAVSGADPALVAEGEKVFKKCAACHKVGEGARNGTGPVLNGIIGLAAGQIDGFKYSDALKTAGNGGLIWTEDTLSAFLADPRGYIKGNRMSFAGLKKDEERTAVIAYLSTFAK